MPKSTKYFTNSASVIYSFINYSNNTTYLLSSIPTSLIKPRIKFLLLYLIMISIPNLLKAEIYKPNNSASTSCPDIPTTSASHCVNSLSLPTLTGPSLKTLAISYL